VGEPHRIRPDDALVEPLFAGLLDGDHGDVVESAPPRRARSARRGWIAWGLALAAALIAVLLAL
jgi:hypothetical protein